MLTHDKKRNKNPVNFGRAERTYARQLRFIGKQIGEMIRVFPAGDISALPTLEDMMRRYAETLTPWAKVAAGRMIDEVNNRDLNTWQLISNELSKGIRDEILSAPVGGVMQSLMDEQVKLIRSLPLEAAQRVHELTIKGLEDGTRVKEVVKEIMRSGEVAANRATLIARTEVSRAAANLTQARAQHIGSDGYIWESSKDADVRPSHKKMLGKFVKWDSPPTLDGLTGHAGCLPNCRCWARVII